MALIILILLTVIGIFCLLPDVIQFFTLVWKAITEDRNQRPPLAGA
jgi:hypothetical protein